MAKLPRTSEQLVDGLPELPTGGLASAGVSTSSTRDFVDQFAQRLGLPAEPPLLRLEPVGPWDPEEEYWGEPGDPAR